MPVYDVEEKWLRLAIESVLAQSYPCWEFCIADDHSPSAHIRKVLDEYASRDDRIKVVYRHENGHISAASNSALELVTGEFTALLDHDDEFSPHALFFVAREINEFPQVAMIYSDEDKIDPRGRRTAPSFKPDWSPELFYSLNMITHLSVYRTSALRSVGGFRVGLEGSQDYDLGLRVSEGLEPGKIRHIPRILYHWRSIPGSVALDSSQKTYAHDRARKSISEHFERSGIAAKVSRGYRELHRATYVLPDPPPKVSLIIVGKGRKDGAERIRANTAYTNLEIIETEEETTASEIDFGSLNEASKKATGSLLCFIGTDSVVRDERWLDELVGIAVQKNIGAVGPRIVYPNRTIKSAGLIAGIGEGMGRAHHGISKYRLGNFYRLQAVNDVSSLPADCLVIASDLFRSVRGFEAETFPKEYADVDLCFRLLKQGCRNVWTPWSEVIQSTERKFPRSLELDTLKRRWPEYFECDPYYNPNLTDRAEDLSLAFPPRVPRT